MTESEFYQRYVKSILESKGISFSRVEQARMPDIFCIKNGVVFWIELKVSPVSKYTVRPDWRPGQLSWIRQYRLNGGRVALGLRVNHTTYFLEARESYTVSDLMLIENVNQEQDYLEELMNDENEL